ncbi:MAG: capsular biosynthesis protein [Epsilonproteobacteria bacterium]|nr:MAG: capsular biosynthesis protein [Campylobacterota bacterium]
MFVISMAGLSSRFFDAGYKQPKYTLQAFGESLFSHAMRSFKNYFDNTPFLFITLDQFDAVDFVRAEGRSIGIADLEIITLDEPTRGQAETVFLGLQSLDQPEQPITIFNIDTAMPNFCQPEFVDECDGYLDVFIGSGSNWSYAKPASPDSNRVIETAEKNPISNLCSTGLYYFASSDDFCAAYKQQIDAGSSVLTGGEVYVAPLYNLLINSGKDIRYRVVDRTNVIFFGTPTEYESLLTQPDSCLNRERL